MMLRSGVVLAGLVSGLLCSSLATASTVERIRERGVVTCGLVEPSVGLASVNSDGQWSGFFIDFCRAVAAAVTKSADAVEFVQLNTQTRFDAVRAGEVDLLAANTTLTLSRESGAGMKFAGIYYFDG